MKFKPNLTFCPLAEPRMRTASSSGGEFSYVGFAFRIAGWWVVAAALSMAIDATGQGTVAFSNAGNQVNAPFFDTNGVLLSGSNYAAQLYAGASPDVLFGFGTPVPFLSGQGAGYFIGPSAGVQLPEPILGGACGPAWVQVRAWETTGGATFEEAVFSGHWTGISTLVHLPYTGGCGGGVPSPPVLIIGLKYPGIPIIVQQPVDRTVPPGGSTHLWVIASGGGKVFYQWYNGVSGDTNSPIPGETTALYQPSNLMTNMDFWVRVTDSAGTTDSTTSSVSIVPYAPGSLTIRVLSGTPTLVIQAAADNFGEIQLQYSTDLNPDHWKGLTNIWQDVNGTRFIDVTATNIASRFYRLALP